MVSTAVLNQRWSSAPLDYCKGTNSCIGTASPTQLASDARKVHSPASMRYVPPPRSEGGDHRNRPVVEDKRSALRSRNQWPNRRLDYRTRWRRGGGTRIRRTLPRGSHTKTQLISLSLAAQSRTELFDLC